MEVKDVTIVLGVLTLLVAICIQTVTIGYFIGNIKSVVVRLVKDVEEIVPKITGAINDLVIAKKDIQDVVKVQGRHEIKIELLESKIIDIEVHLEERGKRNYSQ